MLPSMETPDERLPEQTRLCVQSYASNAAGNATSPEACVTPIASVGPNATMHGLRFDSTRKTNMRSSLDRDSVWTLSLWVKPTENNYYGPGWTNSAGQIFCVYYKDDIWKWYASEAGGASTNTSPAVEYNTWQNLVYRSDGGTGVEPVSYTHLTLPTILLV